MDLATKTFHVLLRSYVELLGLIKFIYDHVLHVDFVSSH
jgi:hypothetical protein